MKKYILLAIFMVGGLHHMAAQQYRTAYFMEGSTLRNNLNPAFRPTRGYVDIPIAGAFAFGLNSDVFTVDNLFKPVDGGDLVSILDRRYTAEMLPELKAVNNMDFNMQTSIIGFGFYSGKGFWDFGVDLKMDGGFSLPGDFFKFYKQGSGTYNMKDLALSMGVYATVSAGYSYKLLPNLTIGARFNYLAGLARMNASYDQLDVNFTGEAWEVAAKGNIELIMAGFNAPVDDKGYIDMDNLGFDVDKIKGLSGSGFSFDLGAEYVLFDKLKISASLLDLGFLKWGKDNVTSGVSDARYSYKGFEVNGQGESVGNSSTGDIDDFTRFRKTESSAVKTKLRSTFMIGAEYPLLGNFLSVGAIYMNKKNEFVDRQEISAALTLRPTKWLTGALSYTFEDHKNIGDEAWNTFGLAVNFHTAWINLFVGTDYMVSRVSPQFVPLGQKVLNLYMGLSIPLSKGNRYY